MVTLLCPHCGKDVNEAPRRRSTGPLSQNHHLNGHLAQIARMSGNDFEDVKVAVKLRAIKRGFPEPKTIRSHGMMIQRLKSESELTPAECAMLIDETHQIADENAWELKE
jgi:hypothetical protein